MEKSRLRIKQALAYESSDRIPVDLGSTAVTGIHCRKERAYFTLRISLFFHR